MVHSPKASAQRCLKHHTYVRVFPEFAVLFDECILQWAYVVSSSNIVGGSLIPVLMKMPFHCHALQVPMRASLRRMWTIAKPGRGGDCDFSCNVLPFLLDISLSLFDTLDLVKSSVDSEVVFQATLQVPFGKADRHSFIL